MDKLISELQTSSIDLKVEPYLWKLFSENKPINEYDLNKSPQFDWEGLEFFKQQILRQTHGRVVIECGHIYGASYDHERSACELNLARELFLQLTANGQSAVFVLLVDDYHEKIVVDVSAYLELANSIGVNFDYVFLESSFCEMANAVIKALEKRGNTFRTKQGVFLEHRNIELVNEEGKYSCAILDACFSIIQVNNLGTGNISVVDSTFRPQQRKKRKLLQSLIHDQNICFYNLYVWHERRLVSAGSKSHSSKFRK